VTQDLVSIDQVADSRLTVHELHDALLDLTVPASDAVVLTKMLSPMMTQESLDIDIGASRCLDRCPSEKPRRAGGRDRSLGITSETHLRYDPRHGTRP